jgi:hypothetical protein
MGTVDPATEPSDSCQWLRAMRNCQAASPASAGFGLVPGLPVLRRFFSSIAGRSRDEVDSPCPSESKAATSTEGGRPTPQLPRELMLAGGRPVSRPPSPSPDQPLRRSVCRD